MRRHTLPCQLSDLLPFAERTANELDTHGRWLEMIGIRADELRRIVDQVKKAEAAWSAAKSAKASAQTRTTAADEALTAWLAKARLVVMLARGEKWSERWIETGFTHGATNVPKGIEPRIALARRVVFFLSLHPKFGVPFAEVTAGRGRSLYERMIRAREALAVATTHCITNKRQRDAAERILRRTMHQVVLMLQATIAPDDPRWIAFGLKELVPDSPRKRRIDRRGVGGALTEPIPLPAETHAACQDTVAA